MSKKVIIFDFDGTIADTIDLIVDILNRLSGKFGYKRIKKGDLENLRNKKSREIPNYLGISIFKLPFVVRRVLSELNKKIESSKVIIDLPDALLKLHKEGYKLGILTTNTKENVTRFLKRNNLELFEFIYTGSSLFGKDKALKSLLKDLNLKNEDVIFVGDETRDIEAAEKTKIKVIAVTWGFNSKKILEEQNPDFLIDKPQDLLTLRVRMS